MYQQTAKKVGSPRALIQMVVTGVVLLIVASRYFDAISIVEIAMAKSTALVESIQKAYIGESNWHVRQGKASIEKATTEAESDNLSNNPDINAAIESFAQAIAHDPQNPEAYYQRAIAYAIKGLSDASMDDLDKSIEINPEYAEAYRLRSLLLASAGKFEDAFSDVNKSIALKPDYFDAFTTRARFYEHQKNWDLVIADYTTAIELTPGDLDRTKALALYGSRGLAYLAKKMLPEAISDFNKFLEAGSDIAQLLRYGVVDTLQEELAKQNTGTELYMQLEDLIAKIKSG